MALLCILSLFGVTVGSADLYGSYEWRQNINEYGIVSYPNASESAFGYTGTPTPITPDFYSLQRYESWACVEMIN